MLYGGDSTSDEMQVLAQDAVKMSSLIETEEQGGKHSQKHRVLPMCFVI